MIVGMVPIKLNNQRIPGKNLKCFDDGMPLVHFIQKAMLGSKWLNCIYVYCSDERIRNYLLPGIKFIKRPEYLDADQCNCNDIIGEFMKSVDADIYCVSHVTGPFTKSSSIDTCIEAVRNGQYDSAFLAKEIKSFLWEKNKALNFDIQNFPRTQDLEPIYEEAPGAYVFTKETFQKYRRRVGIHPYIHEIDEIESRDIDYPIDFAIANAIYMNIIRKDGE